jgi:four helix bundle protein
MDDGFKGLTAWQKAYELALTLYKATKNFPKEEIYGLASQMQRAAVSVPANIAEGYERQYKKEYRQFLSIAKGSLSEIETYLLLCKDLTYITKEEFEGIESLRKETTKLINGLIKKVASYQ